MSAAAEIVAQGRQMLRAQRLEEALLLFHRALALEPDNIEALGNRGSVLGALGRYDEALGDYDRALALSPGHAMLLFNRGNALRFLGRYDEALESYDLALKANPGMAEAWSNRGIVLRDLKRFDEAMASYSRAIALRPDYAKALCNRGNLYWVNLRQIEPALRDFERAFAIDPDCENVRGDLLHLNMHVGQWRDFDRQKALVDEGVRAGRKTVGPFAYQAIADQPADLLTCAQIYARERYPARPPRTARAYAHDRIRVGYLCGEFRQQATSFLTAGLYEAHDKEKFEIIAFDSGWSDESPMRARLEKAFSKFVDISRLADDAAAVRIQAEEIDILVNLNGYFGEDRMGVFARKPAPIQVNYLGFPATLGAGYIDYILADRIVIPEADKRFYSEKVVWLPDSYQANDAKRVRPERTERAASGLPDDAFVFCNFNQSYKLNPHVFAGWMRILKQVPESLLWLLEGNSLFAGNIRREAKAAGVAPERILFAPMVGFEEHLARLRSANLFLDTTPYNAHTTGSDALWAGVPLITCRGTTFPGRVAESLLNAIGLPELVAKDQQDYEALAVRLARDPQALSVLSQKLETNRLAMPLFDTARFARGVEAAYQTMWEMSRAGETPRSFTVPPQV
jgi:predicted O-linked N-acetylglucosamine transferase (SPINDLY family)